MSTSYKLKIILFPIITALAVIALTVYFFYWYNAKPTDTQGYNNFQNKIVLAKELGIDTNQYPQDMTSYSKESSSQISSQTQDLDKQIDAKRTQITQENTVLLSDVTFLDGQIKMLGLDGTAQERTLDGYTSTPNSPLLRDDKSLLPTNQTLKTLETNFKQKITDYTNQLKAKGLFTNALWGRTDSELNDMISKMSNEEKMGQMLMFAGKGYSLDNAYKQELETIHQGGIIYMGWNISNTAQLTKFSKDLQSINPDIPMLLATDEEGGPVQRITWDTTVGETSWASLTDAQLCLQATQRANLLRSLGINVNLAPVVDLTYNGNGFINDRTISGDPKLVTEKAKQAVDCSQANGVATTLKHFPGHGATSQDSHKVLPEITKSKSDWLKTDAVPFASLTESKLIMVGQLQFDSLDKSFAASQSEAVVDGVLRTELGYKGVVITDAMGQLHNSTHVSVRTALTRAFNAGVDIVLYVTTPAPNVDIFNAGVDLLNKKTISPEKVNQSLFRILSMKRGIR